MADIAHPNALPDWTHTQLWLEVKRRAAKADREAKPDPDTKLDPDAGRAARVLQNCLPRIQEVLRASGTSPTDFTLHDDRHAFRVAENMWAVIPDRVIPHLSSFELAHLLLAAYLHDIGMTPQQSRVRQHRDYLLSGATDGLTPADVFTFQAWIDDHADVTVPLLSTMPSAAQAERKADYLVAQYIRAMHVAWGTAWATTYLAPRASELYTGWIGDQTTLCRSHHEGYEQLTQALFNARNAGNHGAIVNLRYLAAVLRVADVIEIDPERTPEVVFAHRDIAEESTLFWWKDHYMSMAWVGRRLTVTARPPRAWVHRAALETMDQIDAELQLCAQLEMSGLFMPIPTDPQNHHYAWDVYPSVNRQFMPLNDTYEYIDGAFRPNTAKLLELLSGMQLYHTPLAAIRELLQNAFDAVREEIARLRLAERDPLDEAVVERTRALQFVTLRLEPRDDGLWLICRDSGVGMTKKIIADYVLVSGASQRHEIRALERQCLAKGFSLERTGTFGIGILSYFMLADRVVFITRRSQAAHGHVWKRTERAESGDTR